MGAAIAEYTAGVDRLLTTGASYFPQGPASPAVEADWIATAEPPSGRGGLADGARDAADLYGGARRGVADLDAIASDQAAASADAGRTGRTGAVQTRDLARAQMSAIAPETHSPAGVKALVSTMDDRLGDMQRHMQDARSANATLAARLRQTGDLYRGVLWNAAGIPASEVAADERPDQQANVVGAGAPVVPAAFDETPTVPIVPITPGFGPWPDWVNHGQVSFPT